MVAASPRSHADFGFGICFGFRDSDFEFDLRYSCCPRFEAFVKPSALTTAVTDDTGGSGPSDPCYDSAIVGRRDTRVGRRGKLTAEALHSVATLVRAPAGPFLSRTSKDCFVTKRCKMDGRNLPPDAEARMRMLSELIRGGRETEESRENVAPRKPEAFHRS